MHILETPCGHINTPNAFHDIEIIREVITEDAYRLKDIAKVYSPRHFFDIGAGVGIVSKVAQSLWPDVYVTAFEGSAELSRVCNANIGHRNTMVATGMVGYSLTAKDISERYGYADMMVIDCEGGEVPFIYDLFQMGTLDRYKVITGEWHGWPSRRLLEACFQEKYHMKFTNPAEGAGPWQTFFAIHKGMTPELHRAWGLV